MKRFFVTVFGTFVFFLFGDSPPLRGQSQPIPPSGPDHLCEEMNNYYPGMCISHGEGNPMGPLANRIPVIFIHGWNPKEVGGEPNLLVWSDLIRYLYNSSWFLKSFKMYFVYYWSNVENLRGMGLTLRSLVSRMDEIEPGFSGRPRIFVGYSMGGLIARSFMKERQPGSARLGGERVLRLITLGTPHHGSPFANGPARDVKAGLEAFLLHQFVDGSLFGYNIRWDMDNRYDLHWDNYDGLFDSEYKSFPEKSLWIEWLNSGETFENKIVAYGGKVSWRGQVADCVLGAERSACLAAVMNQALGISESDGFVPLKSALFNPCKNCIATRIFDGYDHSEIVRGKFRWFGEPEPLFETVANDLLSLVATP